MHHHHLTSELQSNLSNMSGQIVVRFTKQISPQLCSQASLILHLVENLLSLLALNLGAYLLLILVLLLSSADHSLHVSQQKKTKHM